MVRLLGLADGAAMAERARARARTETSATASTAPSLSLARFAAGPGRVGTRSLGTFARRVTAERLGPELPDPDDAMFLEVTTSGAADYLVTGNNRHVIPVRGTHAIAVVTPRDFIGLL